MKYNYLNRLIYVLILFNLIFSSKAIAQWGLERPEADNKKIGKNIKKNLSGQKNNENKVERYKRFVEQHPDDEFAFSKLVELTRKEHGSLQPLIQEYSNKLDKMSEANTIIIISRLFLANNEPDQSIAFLNRAIESFPLDRRPLMILSSIRESRGEEQEAIELLRAALRFSTAQIDKENILKKLIELLVKQRRFDEARDSFHQLIRLSPNSFYTKLTLAHTLERNNFLDEAEQALRELLSARNSPQLRVIILKEIASIQLRQGNNSEAEATIREALRIAREGGVRNELWQILVDIYRENGNLLSLAQELSGQTGQTNEQIMLLGEIYEEIGQLESALQWYNRAKQRMRNNIDIRVKIVRILTQLGRLQEVVAEYESLIQLSHGESRFVLELAEIYNRLGQRDRALRMLGEMSNRFRNNLELHAVLQEIYSRWGETEKAIREAEILTNLSPRDESYWISLGEHYFEQGDQERAKGIWRRILNIIPQPRCFEIMGDVFADHNIFDESIQFYNSALNLEPDSLPVHRKLGEVLERRGNLADALVQWREVLRLAATSREKREARLHIISIWERQRILLRELASLYSSFQQTPNIDTGLLIVDGYIRAGDMRQSIEILQRLTQIERGNIEILSTMEQVYLRLNDLNHAIETVRKLIEVDPPNSPQYYQRLANYASLLYRDDEALFYAEKAVDLSPSDSMAHYKLASIYESVQNWQKAMFHYEKSVKINKHLFKAYISLGDIYQWMGETEKAVKNYLSMLELHPDDEIIEKAGRDVMYLGINNNLEGLVEKKLLSLSVKGQRPSESMIYRKLINEMYELILDPLITYLKSTKNIDEKIKTAEKLREISYRALPSLLEGLQSDDKRQQMVSIELFGYLKNKEAIQPLESFMKNMENQPQLREKAVISLGMINNVKSIPSLADLIKTGDPAIQEKALWAIGNIENENSIKIISGLLNHQRDFIRALSCLSIGRQEAKNYYPILRNLIVQDPSYTVKAACAWGLAVGGDEQGKETLLNLVDNNSVFNTFPDDLKKVILWSLAVIGGSGQREVEIFSKQLWGSNDEKNIELLKWVLGRIGSAKLNKENREILYLTTRDFLYSRSAESLIINYNQGDNFKRVISRYLPSIAMGIGEVIKYESKIRVNNTLRLLDSEENEISFFPIINNNALNSLIDVKQKQEVFSIIADSIKNMLQKQDISDVQMATLIISIARKTHNAQLDDILRQTAEKVINMQPPVNHLLLKTLIKAISDLPCNEYGKIYKSMWQRSIPWEAKIDLIEMLPENEDGVFIIEDAIKNSGNEMIKFKAIEKACEFRSIKQMNDILLQIRNVEEYIGIRELIDRCLETDARD